MVDVIATVQTTMPFRDVGRYRDRGALNLTSQTRPLLIRKPKRQAISRDNPIRGCTPNIQIPVRLQWHTGRLSQ